MARKKGEVPQQFEKDLNWIDKGEEIRNREVRSAGPAGSWPEEVHEEANRVKGDGLNMGHNNELVVVNDYGLGNPEDELIARIDAGLPASVDEEVRATIAKESGPAAFAGNNPHAEPMRAEQTETAAVDQVPEPGAEYDGEVASSARSTPSERMARVISKELKNQRSRKRSESQSMINLHALKKRAQKDSLDQRTSI